jgi:DNA replication licensing factor MCM4
LESLIRLSQALAKMRMSNMVKKTNLQQKKKTNNKINKIITPQKVTRDDVQEAYRLMRVATQAAATDPRTGTIDMDMINTGRLMHLVLNIMFF